MKAIFAFTVVLTLGLLAAPYAVEAQFAYTTNNATITIVGYTGVAGEVVIPSTLDGLPVTDIGDSAFLLREDVTSVTISDGVTAIADWAFARCYGLTRVTLPGSLVSMGEGAFYLCAALTNITIPNNLATIEDWTFSGCASLTEVTFGNRVARIEDRAFSHCVSLPTLAIPDTVTSLGSKAFSSCYSLTNVIIGNSVKKIEDSAFAHCYSLTNVTMGKSVTTIGDWAFFLCANLKTVHFMGDAPAFPGSNLFAGADAVTIYHLPGTTGWNSTFEGRPTALWLLPQPVILNFGAGFGVQTNGFGFVVSWATNLPVVLEASANLHESVWSPVATNTLLEGWTYFSDPRWNDWPARFFRVRPH
jgi:hypothetical protein